MKPAPLPPEFIGLQGQVNYVQQKARTEWTSSCPECGGEPHANGEWPDRFGMFFGKKICAWCRRCSFSWFPDMGENYDPPSAEELETFRQKREESEQARLRSAQRALDNLRDTKLWEKYADMSGEQGRAWWERRGVPYPFQVIWQLGFDYDLTRWGCASATIPLFDSDGQCLNVKHRLEDDSKGRYRYNITGQDAPLWLADSEADMSGHVVAVEGECKGMVVSITLDDPTTTIVGLPGLSPSKSVTDTLAQAERVTLVLDPGSDMPGADGWSPAGKLVTAIGRRKTWVLVTTAKIDDSLLAIEADRWDVKRLLTQAVGA